MIIKTYTKYFYKDFSSTLLLVMLVFFSLTVILNLFEEINFFKDLNVSFFIPLFLTLLNSPSIIYELLPFVFLISSQIFFVKLLQKNELNIFKYSGLSNVKILFTIASFAFFLGIILVFFFYPLTAKLKHVQLNIKNKYTDDNKYLAVITENGIWIRDEIDNQINIINADEIIGNTLRKVSISQFTKDFNFLQNIDVAEIDISNKNWILKDAIITEENFQSNIVPIYNLKTNFDAEKINNLFSNLTALTLIELYKLRDEYKEIGYSTLKIDSNIQKNLSYPLFLSIMTLFAGIIILNIKRNNSYTFHVFLGIALSVGIYYINNFSKILGENERLPLVLSIWIPLLLIGIFCTIGLIRINEK